MRTVLNRISMEIRKEEEKQKKFCEKLLSEMCEIFSDSEWYLQVLFLSIFW